MFARVADHTFLFQILAMATLPVRLWNLDLSTMSESLFEFLGVVRELQRVRPG